MHLSRRITSSFTLVAILFIKITIASTADAGYDVFTSAQVMVNLASHSWEWGTAAEALLELYNNEFSVFGATPFPNGKIPLADSSIFALSYAKEFISLGSQTLVPSDSGAVGDPASLGVSAILLGQSNNAYITAANNQADYILNMAPRYSNGAISQRATVAELWADNMAMSFPFLAYQAVSTNNASLMAETVRQCGLYRDILKTSSFLNWQHIIGPQSQDTGLWSTGNGWAAYGMVRVLHTLQKWSGSSGQTSQASSLKSWIKEILDGAMQSGLDGGLLRNYLNDNSWFGEISGTALLTAAAYRMAVNDPATFPQKYITWADSNRISLSKKEGSNGIFSPAVDPYSWGSKTEYSAGSPEGQAFTVYLYSAYRDCVSANICQSTTASATTISKAGIGPIDILTVFDSPVTFTFSSMPSGPTCGAPQSCDLNGCAGTFDGLSVFPTCTAGTLKGCQCTATTNTCGAHQSCDMNGCAGAFKGLNAYAVCTGNFVGCECTATTNTCGAHQSCDLNGCAGAFNGLTAYPVCTGNFIGCECTATTNTCGAHQSCDLNGCAGAFNGLTAYPVCTGNFIGCECTATTNTCGSHQSCDLNGCAGAFLGNTVYPQCTGNFIGCECTATSNTCGASQSCDLNGCRGQFNGLSVHPQCAGNFVGCPCTATANTCGNAQSCDLNGCAGAFNLNNGIAFCEGNFVGCKCAPTSKTCGNPQSCDNGNCAGAFSGDVAHPQCTNFFAGCQCTATSNTCGSSQSCDLNGCAGAFDLSSGKAFCTDNFVGCGCSATSNTCGQAQSCDQDNCQGAFNGLTPNPQCTNFFKGCVCKPTSNTCGAKQSCASNGCNGAYNAQGVASCQGNFQGCQCNPTSSTCGAKQSCDLNGCKGAFTSNGDVAVCTGNFPGCPCNPTSTTCGSEFTCQRSGCDGIPVGNGVWECSGSYNGCPCIAPLIIPPPPPPVDRVGVVIALFEDQVVAQMPPNPPPIYQWWIFEAAPNSNLDVCNTRAVSEQNTNTEAPPEFPASLSSFSANGASGCTYSGSTTSIGSMSCPGVSGITCQSDLSDELACGFGIAYWTRIFCEWV